VASLLTGEVRPFLYDPFIDYSAVTIVRTIVCPIHHNYHNLPVVLKILDLWKLLSVFDHQWE
jgi:hypothetical protein